MPAPGGIVSLRFQRLNPIWNSAPRPFKEPTCFVFCKEKEMLETYSVSSYEPKVDFTGNVVVSYHRGLCRSGGYRVRILQTSIKGREVIIRVRLTDPQPGDLVTLVFTYPYDIVQIPRSDLQCFGTRRPILFRFVVSGGREVCRREVSID